MARIGWRLVSVSSDGQVPCSLMHGHPSQNGRSRRIPLNTWMEAEVRRVHNPGSKDQPHWLSGWHAFPDYETAAAYAKRFKKSVAIVQVELQDFWRKPTNTDVFLSRWMRLTSDAWNRREET